MIKKFITTIITLGFAGLISTAQRNYMNLMDLPTEYQEFVNTKFVYSSMTPHTFIWNQPPFPFKNGRIRDGKYKASPSAMDSYLQSLKALNGTILTFLKYTDEFADNWGGRYLMSTPQGDTLALTRLTIMFNLVPVESIEAHKCHIGKKFYVTKRDPSNSQAYIAFNAKHLMSFTNKKTGVVVDSLPYDSQWIVEDVTYGYDCFEETQNERVAQVHGCLPNRIKWTIKNDRLGTYTCYPYPTFFSIFSPYAPYADNELFYSYFFESEKDREERRKSEEE